MTGFDRSAEFARRETATYNEPPETPADGMWTAVEERLAGIEAASSSRISRVAEAGAPAGVGSADGLPFEALGRNQPPSAPREEMWVRIEAALTLRSRADVVDVGAGAARGSRTALWTRLRRRRAAGWAAALATAASLALWTALDRSAGLPSPDDAGIAPDDARIAPDGNRIALPSETPVVQFESAEFDAVVEPPGNVSEAADPVLEVEMAGTMAADLAPDGRSVGNTVETRLAELPDLFPRSGEDYVRTRHMERAAMLLTAFRIDQRTSASQRELARWSRKMLVDTRAFLDMPVSRSPLERALLEDLELVLLQISRLGAGMPDFEWKLARESMDGNGILMRLRAESALGDV